MQAAALVNRLLCAHDGRMELEDLYGQISGLDLNDEVETVLKDMFVTPGDEKVVLAKTSLRLCRDKDCESCSSLHLCKLYLFGDCPYSKEWRGCRFCHDLCLEHNVNLLQQHNLLDLDRSELCVILLQNDSTLLPPVCFPYNKGSGEYGNCPDKEACNRLHICENYIRGTCEGGAECRRCHDIYEPHPMNTLQHRGVPSQMMGSLHLIYQNIMALKHRSGTRAGSKHDTKPISKVPESLQKNAENMICLSFVKGYCKFGDKCWRIHFNMPYKWEVKVDQVWTDLPDSESIERDYCDPTKIHSMGIEPVCFDTMTQGLHSVRRLTTESSVVEPTFALTTKWTWYWEDEYRTWIQYGSVREMHRLSSINSEDLEQKYMHFLKEKNNAVLYEFTAGKQCYEINFTDMKQRNRLTGMERIVRRRPVFVSSSEVQSIQTTRNRSVHTSSYKGVPGFWDKSAIPDSGFQRVTLSPSDKDYIRVQERFMKTMKNSIVSIERVQNKELWEDFQTKRERMKKANKDKKYGEGERLLFHGTKSSLIDAICRQNFDIRVSGANATVYGQGSYFARDAKYSHSYTEEYGDKSMFACRVLVGQYTKGASHYRRPPARDAAGTLYDSCVNDVKEPTIYVVFERPQVYPEFLITYKDDTFSGGYALGRSTPSDIIPTSNPTAFLDVSQNSAASCINMSKTRITILPGSSHSVHAVSSSSHSTGQVLSSPSSNTESDPLTVLHSTLNQSEHLPSTQRESDSTEAKTANSCPVLAALQRENAIHSTVTHNSAGSAEPATVELPAESFQDLLTAATVPAFSRSHDLSLNTVKPSLSGDASHSEDVKDQNTGSSCTSVVATMPASQGLPKNVHKPANDISLDSEFSELSVDDLDSFLTKLAKNPSFPSCPSLDHNQASSVSCPSGSSFSHTDSTSFSSTQKPSISSDLQQAEVTRKLSPPKQKKSDCVMQ